MTVSALPVLTCLVWAPAAGALVVLALRNDHASLRRWVAVGASLVSLGLAALVFWKLDPAAPRREITPWIGPLGVSYELGVDGFGSMIALWIALLAPLVLLSESRKTLDRRVAALVLFSETALLGLYASRDFVLFLAFYGGGLVAMTLLHRRPGAMKGFFVFQTGALFLQAGLLLACFHLAWAQTGFPSAEIVRLSSLVTYPDLQSGLFLLGSAAFAFAAPLFPVATWLKDSEEALSAPSLTFLLGGWSLAGAAFFVRIVLPSFPLGASEARGVVSLFASLSVLFAGIAPYRGTRERSWLPVLVGLQALSLLGLLATSSEGIVAGRMGLLELGLGMAALGLSTGRAGSQEGMPLTHVGKIGALGVVLAVVLLPSANGLPVWWIVLTSAWSRSRGVALLVGTGLVLIVLRLLVQVPTLGRMLERNRSRKLLLLLPLFAWWLFLAGSQHRQEKVAAFAPDSVPATSEELDEGQR